MVGTNPGAVRRHDLDALRAFAMILGIFLHAWLAYTSIPWVVNDPHKWVWFDFLHGYTHNFRMPLFFLLSGFFTAMLVSRRGLRSMIGHRTRRILLPLLLGSGTVVPLVWGAIGYANVPVKETVAVGERPDLWAAAGSGDVEAIRWHAGEGADLNAQEPMWGVTALGMTAITGQPEAAGALLELGADPDAPNRDMNRALHTALFFGRAETARVLLDHGADLEVVNGGGETPLDSMRHNEQTTVFIAKMLKVEGTFGVEEGAEGGLFAAVEAGRAEIRAMLDVDESALSGEQGAAGHGSGRGSRVWAMLTGIPVFHHLWFLWFLCWFVALYALVVVVGRGVAPLIGAAGLGGALRGLGVLVSFPWCLVYVVPLTAWTQSMMVSPFGPDTSVGLVPIPRLLAHYAVFYMFGALLFSARGVGFRVGRRGYVALVVSLALYPFGLAVMGLWNEGDALGRFVNDSFGEMGLARSVVGYGAQALIAWCAVFGLIGVCERLLSRERWWVRYVSDSSYWLYLAHLPLVMALQRLLLGVEAPGLVKFAVIVVVTTGSLLVTYRWCVRYGWIGTLLNGPRERAGGRAKGSG